MHVGARARARHLHYCVPHSCALAAIVALQPHFDVRMNDLQAALYAMLTFVGLLLCVDCAVGAVPGTDAALGISSSLLVAIPACAVAGACASARMRRAACARALAWFDPPTPSGGGGGGAFAGAAAALVSGSDGGSDVSSALGIEACMISDAELGLSVEALAARLGCSNKTRATRDMWPLLPREGGVPVIPDEFLWRWVSDRDRPGVDLSLLEWLRALAWEVHTRFVVHPQRQGGSAKVPRASMRQALHLIRWGMMVYPRAQYVFCS
jgi:hypothetical protein